MKINYQKDALIFKAFCDEKRLYILEILGDGERCACNLIEKTGMAQSALSYHMKILCDAGIVTSRQEGKWKHYSISHSGRAHALERLAILTSASDDSMNRLCQRKSS